MSLPLWLPGRMFFPRGLCPEGRRGLCPQGRTPGLTSSGGGWGREVSVQRGMGSLSRGETPWTDIQWWPLQRSVCILLECILVRYCDWLVKNLLNHWKEGPRSFWETFSLLYIFLVTYINSTRHFVLHHDIVYLISGWYWWQIPYIIKDSSISEDFT